MDEVLFCAERKRGDGRYYPFMDEELRQEMQTDAIEGIMGSNADTTNMMLQRIFNGKLYIEFNDITPMLASNEAVLWGA